MDKKLTCIEKGKSIDDYYDETEELTGKQAIEKAKRHFNDIITRTYKEEHLGLNDRPIRESLDLLKRDLTDEEMFNALLENNLRMFAIKTIMKKYDMSKVKVICKNGTHCAYVDRIDETGESEFAKMIAPFILGE